MGAANSPEYNRALAYSSPNCPLSQAERAALRAARNAEIEFQKVPWKVNHGVLIDKENRWQQRREMWSMLFDGPDPLEGLEQILEPRCGQFDSGRTLKVLIRPETKLYKSLTTVTLNPDGSVLYRSAAEQLGVTCSRYRFPDGACGATIEKFHFEELAAYIRKKKSHKAEVW